jgi:N,N-dimethylformamidase
MRIVGYSDRLTVRPGEPLRFMVSADTAEYEADLVRLIHGDTNPAGPGLKLEDIPSALAGTYRGRRQEIRPGSYAHARLDEPIQAAEGLTALLWIYPTTPALSPQTLMTLISRGEEWFRLRLVDRFVQAETGDEPAAFLRLTVPTAQWSRVAASYEAATGAMTLCINATDVNARQHLVRRTATVDSGPSVDELMIAARPDPTGGHCEHYNGKIGAPSIYDRVLSEAEISALDNRIALESPSGPVLAWDFSLDIETDAVTDRSGHGRHGRTVQRPTRGVTGHDWDGIETSWRHALPQYDAVHFHDDDLDDVGWSPGIVWQVPEDLPSAVYALRLRAGTDEDFLPFVVTPKRGAHTARIALLVPTFTYLAYANDQILMTHLEPADRGDYPVTPEDTYIVANRMLSLYDRHSDRSGVCYASALRPLVNVRPTYDVPWMYEQRGAPHGLNADLHLVDWLHETGYEIDVITDHDLHMEGVSLLEPYAVVLTGSHPEYSSREMLDALSGYVASGGHLMYLGGNGAYWVTQLDEQHGHTVEIRRRGPATRVWEPEPGEAHLSVNGELGGLWRFRGRSPQSWLGVGFTAQGLGPGRPYVREPASFDPVVAWVFDGLGPDEQIGDLPSLLNGYGAAAYEIDRADPELGTPEATVVLARATEFSDSYQAVSEEIFEADSAQGGSVNPKVRSDLTLTTYDSGGAVFSVGSIGWVSCLSSNGYDNTVARVTQNVLDRFLEPEPL